MASRTVRRVKRGKGNSAIKEHLPAIVVTPPETADMKVKASKKSDGKNANITTVHGNKTNETAVVTTDTAQATTMTALNVNQIIAELSENSRASKDEIENIQRKLIQQANEILKVNTFANTQPLSEPRIIDSTQKYSTNKPVYGRIPVVIPRNNMAVSNQPRNGLEFSRQTNNPNMAAQVKAGRPDTQLDTQLVPERLQEHPFLDNAMINAQGNMQRVALTPVDAGRGFFYETGSGGRANAAASARAASTRGECLIPFSNTFFERFKLESFTLCSKLFSLSPM